MKMKFRNGIFSGMIIAVLATVLMFAGTAQADTHLNMGSTSSTSGVYAWCVAAANVINKADNGIQVTVVESGAGMDNLRKISAGVFDFAMAIDLPGSLQLYKGIEGFEGKQFKDVRWLFLRNIFADRLYVRKDSGVTSFADLKGKRFCPGIPGSASAAYIMQYDKILGHNIQLVPSALGDAINALKENRIVGLQKSSGLNNIDASLIEVNLMTPLTVVGYSEEDVKKIQEKIPYMTFLKREKGSIKEFPDVGPIWEECPIAGAVATASMPEEVGYQIVKAYVEGFEEIAAAYGPVKGFDPVGDYFKNAGDDVVPAHAGLIRYAKEKGIDVPERFIPPEYKK
jgi:TRAP transporter TAXI family solute receptor